MSAESRLVGAFEGHETGEIRKALAKGVSPTALIGGKTPIAILIEMYTRSENFAECVRIMLDAGATTGDPMLEALLLDDESALRPILDLQRKFSPLCAYTSCEGVSALHICAEFNSVRCAKALIMAGADVNARANIDANGLGGQTPLFHTVNSNGNHCRPMMELLVDSGADLDVRIDGLVWGDTMDWETVVFDVTPLSYAQCGLYRQFHRHEPHIYSNIDYLHRKRYGTPAPIRNVPNKYVFPPPK